MRGGLKAAKYDVPRIAEGKYLKLLHEMFDHAGLLGLGESEIRERVPGLVPVLRVLLVYLDRLHRLRRIRDTERPVMPGVRKHLRLVGISSAPGA